MDPEIRNKYFGNNWQPNYDQYKYSGWSLIDKIQPHEKILDIGCGFNLFKDTFGDRLYGIDPVNDEADEIVGIMEFETDKQWDVAFALGSLNFGTVEDVEPQVEKAISLLKPGGRIYWRQNPGLGDHPWKGVETIQFFPWSIKLNYEWADKYNCALIEAKWDNSDRIYAEWKKHKV